MIRISKDTPYTMKKAFLILFFVTCNIAIAQSSVGTKDTTNFTDANGKKQGKWIILNRDVHKECFKDDQKVEEGKYLDSKKTGPWKEYYCNSNVKSVVTYENNRPNGYAKMYHENGKISFIKEFKNSEAVGIWMKFDKKGNLVSQLNTRDKKDSLNLIYLLYREEVFQQLEDEIFIDYGEDHDAIFTEGTLNQFVAKNYKYPDSAFELGLQGKIYVKFAIEIDGTVTDVKIVRGLPDCPECDLEAIKLMKSMPNWIPAVKDRKRVKSYMQFPIIITLR